MVSKLLFFSRNHEDLPAQHGDKIKNGSFSINLLLNFKQTSQFPSKAPKTMVHEIVGQKTLGRYSVTIIIGLLWVTAPRNWTTFGCRIFWNRASSSLKAFL